MPACRAGIGSLHPSALALVSVCGIVRDRSGSLRIVGDCLRVLHVFEDFSCCRGFWQILKDSRWDSWRFVRIL